jgi:iron complex outermembrane receptor protein
LHLNYKELKALKMIRFLYILISFIILLFTNSSLSAQTLKGRILDQDNRQPIARATIFDGQKEATSDEQGYFETDTKSDSLTISHVSYLSQIIQLKKGIIILQILLKPNPFLLNEVQVSAYQSTQSLLNTAGAVSILTRQDISRDNELNLAPVLNRVSGIFMQSGTLSTNRITMRGIGSRSLFSTAKIRAYWNEIPLTSGEGSTDIEDIDLSLLGRIEIIKGPAASIYGAGLGGTILLQSERADYQQTRFSQQTQIGSFGLQRWVSSLKTGSDKFNLNLNYNQTQSDGWRANNQFDRKSLSATGDVSVGENRNLSFLASWIGLKAFIPSSIDSLTFAQNPRAAAGNWAAAQGFEDYDKVLLGLAYEQDFNPNWALKTSIFTNFKTSYEPRPFNILRENNQRLGLRGRVIHQTQLNNTKIQSSFGGEYFREWYSWQTYRISNRVRGNILSDNQEIRAYYNIFAQSHLEIGEKWSIDAGLNLNRTEYQVEDFYLADDEDISGAYNFNAILSPRLAFNYIFKKNQSIFLGLSHGFSPPSVEETLTPSGQINPNIRPERGWNYELGSRGSLFESRLQYDVVLYWMFVQDLLVARRTAEDAFVGINAGKTWHRGLELSLNYALTNPNSAIKTQVFLTYSVNDYTFQEFVDDEDDFSGNVLTGVPSQVFNTGIDFTSKWGVYGNLNYQFVDEMPIRDDNSLFSDAYSLLNLKLGFQKTWKNGFGIDFYAGIQNLLDEKYASQVLINATAFGNAQPRYYYPGLPRNYFMALKVSYGF